MKSIVEEASSIVKAIEKAWMRAGKPASFQVKIFEEPQKNFFGLTVRSAKIGLFFVDGSEKVEKIVKPEHRKEVRIQPKFQREELQKPKEESGQKDRDQKKRWTPEMVKSSQEWLDYMLESMGHRGKRYTIDPKGFYLNVVFESPILAEKFKEQMLFKSLAHLMVQMLRTKFKKGFIGYKVVLKSV